MTEPITITEAAESQLLSLEKDAPEGTQGIRLNIKQTGCSGNSYKMEYIKADEDISQDDCVHAGNSKIYIPKIYSWMLFGLTVDYIEDELGNARFDFTNPNEVSRCGCGESFTVNPPKKAE